MTRIPEHDRDILEQAIYLPMLLTNLNRDLHIVEHSPFKLKKPYTKFIEKAMGNVHSDLARVKRYMKQHRMKAERIKSDDAFTMYLFLYKGYEEYHNYFNPRLKNRIEELMVEYFFRTAETPAGTAGGREPDGKVDYGPGS